MSGVERTTILLKPYARTIYLEEDPDGFVLHLNDRPRTAGIGVSIAR